MAHPHITVTPATPADRLALDRLMQLYCYDFSQFADMPIGDDGRFGDPQFIEEQLGGNHDIYMIRADGQLAGFAIVTRRSLLTGNPEVTDMAQFFVLRPCRRRGVGAGAARQLFDRYPGPWEVRVIATNTPAQAFWRRIIKEYTEGVFSETQSDSPRQPGLVFSFRASPQPGQSN